MTNKLLWFSAPPAAIPSLPKSKHSLSYLAWKAGKKAATNGKAKAKGAEKSEALIPELKTALASVALQAEVMRVGSLVGEELERKIKGEYESRSRRGQGCLQKRRWRELTFWTSLCCRQSSSSSSSARGWRERWSSRLYYLIPFGSNLCRVSVRGRGVARVGWGDVKNPE